jgi:hypothetical protein
MEAEASGGDGDRKLPGNAELLDEAGQRFAEVFQCSFLGVSFAVRSQTRTQLGVGTPHAILVAFHDDWHRYCARFGHETTIARGLRSAVSPLVVTGLCRELVKHAGSGSPGTIVGRLA